MLIKNAIYLPILVALTTACTGGGGSSNGPGPISANNVSAEPKIKFEAFAEDMKASELEEAKKKLVEALEASYTSFEGMKAGQNERTEFLVQYKSGVQMKAVTLSTINDVDEKNLKYSTNSVTQVAGLSLPVEVKYKSTLNCTTENVNRGCETQSQGEPTFNISLEQVAKIEEELSQKGIQCSFDTNSNTPSSEKNSIYGETTLASGEKLPAMMTTTTRSGNIICRNTQTDKTVSETSGTEDETYISTDASNSKKTISARGARLLHHSVVKDDKGNVLSIVKTEILGFN